MSPEEEWAWAVLERTRTMKGDAEKVLVLALAWARDAPLADRHQFTEFAHMVEQDFEMWEMAEKTVLEAVNSQGSPETRREAFDEAMRTMQEISSRAISRGMAIAARGRPEGRN
jgi:hypothetical protein